MTVETLIKVLQKEVKKADRANASIEIWCDEQEYEIESMELRKINNKMEETYFIIRNSDGDTTVRAVTKEELLRDLEDGEYRNVLTELPNEPDTNYWGEDVLIIKGKLVAPKAEQVITKYNIE